MPNTPKGEATRQRILTAAWELSDARGAEVILGGVTLREIAAAAGMTPSAVTYHFPTMRELCVAMVEHLASSVSLLPLEAVEALLDLAAQDGLAAMVRLAAQTNWDMLTEPAEVDFERRLARCYAATGDNPDSAEIKRLIGTMTTAWIDDIASVYRRTAERSGLRPIEPFDFQELARGAAAVTEGMLYHWMCSPDAVRADLAADLLVTLVSTVMVPETRAVTLDEVIADLPRPPARAPSDPAADLHLAAEAASLFGTGVHAVTLTDASRVMGISTEEAATRFGAVTMIAALAFGRHVPAVREAADRRRDLGPEVSLTDAVLELGRCALADPHCALALLHERQRAAAGWPAGTHDPRRSVPLGVPLASPILDLTGGRAEDAADVAELVVDQVLGHASTRSRASVHHITETALRLVPAEF